MRPALATAYSHILTAKGWETEPRLEWLAAAVVMPAGAGLILGIWTCIFHWTSSYNKIYGLVSHSATFRVCLDLKFFGPFMKFFVELESRK